MRTGPSISPRIRPHSGRWGAILIALLTATVVAGCGRGPGHGQGGPLDLTSVPIPRDLRGPLEQARKSLRDPGSNAASAGDLARYFDLAAGIQRPASRREAGDELYARWRAAPTHFLWIELAARYNTLLRRKAERDEMYALPALADSQSAVGAFVLGRRFYGYGDRGRHYRRAEGQMATLDSLQQAWLTPRLAMVEADAGENLAATARLLAALPRARAVAGAGLEAELWRDIAEYLRRADRLDGALHAAVMSTELARAAGLGYPELQSMLTAASILRDRRETQLANELLAQCVDLCAKRDFPLLGATARDQAADLLVKLGNRRQALAFDLRNVGATQAMCDSVNVPRALMSVADDYRRLGQLDSCLAYQDRARNWVARFPNARNRATLPAMLAPYYCQIGDFATADSLLAVSGELAPSTGTAAYEAGIQVDLLRDALDLDRPDLAYRAISRLRQLRPSLGNTSLLAEYELVSAEFLTRQGEFGLASAALDEAAPLIVHGTDVDRRWRLAMCTGRLAVLRGDLDTARSAFLQCLTMAEQIAEEDWTAISRFHLGEVLLEQGQFAAARQLFTGEGDNAYGGRFRTRLSSRLFLGMAWLREGQPARALDELEQAHDLCARRASGDLLTRLHIETARAQAAVGDSRDAERSALAAMALLDRPTGAPWFTELPALGDDLRHDALEVLIGLYVDHPHLLSGADLARHTLALAGNEAPAPPSTAGVVATYFVGRQRSFLWVADNTDERGEITLSALPGRRQLLEIAGPVIANLERPGRPVDAAALRGLADVLLGPVASHWHSGTTLTLVPDDVLAAVPWAALPLADNRPALERGPIEELATSRRASPSPAVESTAGRPRPGPADLLAIGCDGASSSPRLHEAESEARQVAALWPAARCVVRLGDEAAWDSITGLDLERFAVIHIATHTVAYAGLPAAATLRLADGAQGQPLTIDAIRGLHLRARLVYLSCCEAASSHAGSGVDSFVRAFLDAGCGAVLASTIRVDDEAAVHLALGFYRHWQAGDSAAQALRAALLELRAARSEWDHPYYWGFYRVVTTSPV